MADDRKAMLREQWDAAIAKDEEEEVEAPAEATEPAPEPAAEEPPAEAAEDKAEPASQKDRDDKGRFVAKDEKTEKQPGKERAPAAKGTTTAVPKPAPAPATAAQTQAPTAAVTTATPAPATRPPASWTAAARETWKDVPPAAQQEIHRLEGETRRVLQDNAGLRKTVESARQFREGIDGFVRPYEGIFRAQGVEPLQGVANVVQTYAALHYGPPGQKAQILAQLIGQFSSVDDVNAVLSGTVQPTQAPQYRQPQPQQQPVDVRAAIREEIQGWQDQALNVKADQDWDTFAATQPEFLNDVWDDMQALLDSAAERGRNLPFLDAYNRACKMNEAVQGVLQQREAAKAASLPSATAPTVRARAAAATVRSRPTGPGGTSADPTDRRALLQAESERLRNR